jgi:NAD(P)-dependent dehydrogenase (short-subunit alcohol dehydrogenase family)
MSLKSLTALVTGAGGGIGREIALSLAKEKVKVILFGGNNLENLSKTEELIKEVGGECIAVPGNLTNDEVLKSQFNSVIEKVGGLDILINNAGVAYSNSVEDTPIDVFDKVMSINARVPFILTQMALPYLKKSKRASVINVSSVVAHNGYPLQSAYTASKHALLGFTKSLANEVYKDGVRVHAISPGGVYTDMIKIARPDLDGESMIKPTEIADIVLFLLKNRGNAVIDEIVVHRPTKPPFLV